MSKITYKYSSIAKQAWFYAGILFLILYAIMLIQVRMLNIEGYADRINLPVFLIAIAIGIILFFILSLGHHCCYSIYDEEKIIYVNRLFRRRTEFKFRDATAVIFDRWGVKFYDSQEKLNKNEKPLFYVPFFRDGRVDPLEINAFFALMKRREEESSSNNQFRVYKSFRVLPGYGKRWKMLSFAYACLTILVLINCARPLSVIIALFTI